LDFKLKNTIDMKRNTIILILLATILTSCEFLDYTEKTFYEDSEEIFSNFNRTNQFLVDIYNRLPDDYSTVGGAMRSAACDEAEYVIQSSDIQQFNNGQWSASNALDNNWSNYFSGIRSVNLFLENVEGRLFEEYQYNDDYEDQMARFEKFQYEARFLRAFFYFELAKRYGDIPMPNVVVNDVAEINSIQKTSFDNVITYIVDECDAISDSLPVTWKGQYLEETGRVTRGAVQALKVRALLYAASPLHNSTNDVTKWEAAAEAANDFIMNPDFPYTFNAVYYNSNNMAVSTFNNRASLGLIFERRQGTSNSFETSNFPKGFDGANGQATCPSENLVSAYQTLDGYDVLIDGSGVWSAPGSAVFDPVNPYDNRDKRLLQTVIVNGKAWKGTTVQTYFGGANGLPLADATPTGYYLKKYVREDIEIAGSNAAPKEHVWVIFRLAEMYLSYAEAMNEAYGPTTVPAGFMMDAVSALNAVRTRAAVGLPALGAVTESELRSAIIKERQVELAFEDHRFWDVRRWKLLDSANPDNVTEDVYGMQIINDEGTLKYTKKLVDDRTWNDKMYLYPIPYNETKINANLTQNTGW
jgi:starch-binding outer membrane protein, SusD/RagB family